MKRAAKAPAALTIFGIALSAVSSAAPISGAEAPAQSAHQFRILSWFTPASGVRGMLLEARVNHGPRLRLLIDSGAEEIVLGPKAALRSRCTGGTGYDLVSAGAPSAVAARRLSADTVEIGDLTWHDVPLIVAGHRISGVDGVLPLSIFAGFLIRLDIPREKLDLLPYSLEQPGRSEGIRALSSGRLLFLAGTLNDSYEGYFLLDTGASYTAISPTVATRLNLSEARAGRVPLQGGTALLDAPLLGDSISFRSGATKLLMSPVVAVDLSTASRYHKLEVSGLIGYPALRDSVLSVNYRDKVVSIDPIKPR